MNETSAKIAVLLCTYNGNRFLPSQLESLLNQTGVSSEIYASDDGSTDQTLDILENAAKSTASALVDIRKGPGLGSSRNFLSLVCNEDIKADYFAYSDQDDIWDADKLSRATSALSECPDSQPALYCARTRSMSETGKIEGNSPLFKGRPSFANALVHNIGGGNTMVMNRSAIELLRRAGVAEVVSHDWWTYLLVSGAGGCVIYDPKPCLNYRQHAGNLIGANTGITRRLARYVGALKGSNRAWNDSNLRALTLNSTMLTPENQERLRVFEQSRNGSLYVRLRGISRAGLYAQSLSGNLGLFFASLLKKI